MLIQVSLLMIILFIIESFLIFNLMKTKKQKPLLLNKSLIEKNLSNINIYEINGNKKKLIDVLEEESCLFFIDRNCKSCKEMMETILMIKPTYLRNVIFFITNDENNTAYETNLKNDHRLNIFNISEDDLFEKLNIMSFPSFIKVKNKDTISEVGFASKNNVTNYIS